MFEVRKNNNTLNSNVNVRLSTKEKEILLQAAQKKGINVSDFIRLALSQAIC